MFLCLLEIIEIRYPQRTLSPPRGSSIKLSCEAYYNFKECGLLHVVWCNFTKQGAELTDPSKYFSTVNETRSDGHMRHRQVVTEIPNLTPEDNGQFQCKATCDNGESAMGHFIWITVQGIVVIKEENYINSLY